MTVCQITAQLMELDTNLITDSSVTVNPDAPYLVELNGFSSELTVG